MKMRVVLSQRAFFCAVNKNNPAHLSRVIDWLEKKLLLQGRRGSDSNANGHADRGVVTCGS